MPVFDPTMTADKAAATMPADILNASGHQSENWNPDLFQTKGYIDARRKGRAAHNLVAPELEMFKERKRIPVHIFNVGPFAHFINTGSTGTFYIPACPEGKEYIEMATPLFELVDEIYPRTRNSEPKRLYEEGRKFAVEILGEGRNQDKRNSKRSVGVFIAAGERPTAKELEAAREELRKTAAKQILFMDTIWDRDRKLAYEVFRPETFGAYARVMGLSGKEKGWLTQGTPSNKVNCRWCQEPVDPNAPICHNCKNVVNRDKYLEMKAEEEELQAAVAPKKAK